MADLVGRTLQILGETTVTMGKEYASNIMQLKTDAELIKNDLMSGKRTVAETYKTITTGKLTRSISDWFYGKTDELGTMDSNDEFDSGMGEEATADDGETKPQVLDADAMKDITKKQAGVMASIAHKQTQQSVINTAEIISSFNSRSAEMLQSINNINQSIIGINNNLEKLISMQQTVAEKQAEEARKNPLFNSSGMMTLGSFYTNAKSASQDSFLGQLLGNAGMFTQMGPAGLLAATLGSFVVGKSRSSLGGRSIDDVARDFNDMIGEGIHTALTELVSSKELQFLFGGMNSKDSNRDYKQFAPSPKYDTKQAVFDNMTRQTIVSVIPEYLKKITEGITGKTYHVNTKGEVTDKGSRNNFTDELNNVSFGSLSASAKRSISERDVNIPKEDLEEAYNDLFRAFFWSYNGSSKRTLKPSEIPEDIEALQFAVEMFKTATGKSSSYAARVISLVASQLANGRDGVQFTTRIIKEWQKADQETITAVSEGRVAKQFATSWKKEDIMNMGRTTQPKIEEPEPEQHTRISDTQISGRTYNRNISSITSNVKNIYDLLKSGITVRMNAVPVPPLNQNRNNFDNEFYGSGPGNVIDNVIGGIREDVSSVRGEKRMSKRAMRKAQKQYESETAHVQRQLQTLNIETEAGNLDKIHADNALAMMQTAVSDGNVAEDLPLINAEIDKIQNPSIKDSLRNAIPASLKINSRDDDNGGSKFGWMGILGKVIGVALHPIKTLLRGSLKLIGFLGKKILGAFGKLMKFALKTTAKGVKQFSQGLFLGSREQRDEDGNVLQYGSNGLIVDAVKAGLKIGTGTLQGAAWLGNKAYDAWNNRGTEEQREARKKAKENKKERKQQEQSDRDTRYYEDADNRLSARQEKAEKANSEILKRAAVKSWAKEYEGANELNTSKIGEWLNNSKLGKKINSLSHAFDIATSTVEIWSEKAKSTITDLFDKVKNSGFGKGVQKVATGVKKAASWVGQKTGVGRFAKGVAQGFGSSFAKAAEARAKKADRPETYTDRRLEEIKKIVNGEDKDNILSEINSNIVASLNYEKERDGKAETKKAEEESSSKSSTNTPGSLEGNPDVGDVEGGGKKKKGLLSRAKDAITGGGKTPVAEGGGGIAGALGIDIGKMLGGISNILLGIGSAVLGVITGMEGFQALMNIGQEILEKGLKPLNEAFEKIKEAIQPIIDIVTDIITVIAEMVTSLVESIIDVIQPIIEALQPILTTIIDLLSPLLDVVGVVARACLVPITVMIKFFIAPLMKIVADCMQITMGVVQMIFGAVSTGFGLLVSLVGTALTYIGKIPPLNLTGLSKSGQKLAETGDSLKTSGSSMFKSGIESVKTGATALPGDIVNMVTSRFGEGGVIDTVIDTMSGNKEEEETETPKEVTPATSMGGSAMEGLIGSGDTYNYTYMYGSGNTMNQNSYGTYMNMDKHGCGPVALADAYNRRMGGNVDPLQLALAMKGSGPGYDPNMGTSVSSMISAGSMMGMNMIPGGVTEQSLTRATPNNPITILGSGVGFGTRYGNNHYVNVVGTDHYGGAFVSNPMTGKVSRVSRASLASGASLGLYGSGDSDDYAIKVNDEAMDAYSEFKKMASSLTSIFNTEKSESEKLNETMDAEKENIRKQNMLNNPDYKTAWELYKAENGKPDGMSDAEFEEDFQKNHFEEYLQKVYDENYDLTDIKKMTYDDFDSVYSGIFNTLKDAAKSAGSSDGVGGWVHGGGTARLGGSFVSEYTDVDMTDEYEDGWSKHSPIHDFFQQTSGTSGTVHSSTRLGEGNYYKKRYDPDKGGEGSDGEDHRGIDFAGLTAGSKLYATTDGVVRVNAFQDGGAGNYLTWEDSDGGLHTYMHMARKPSLEEGDSVVGGETVIGEVGETGGADGIHLHYGIQKPDGTYVNPLLYFLYNPGASGGLVGDSNRDKIWWYLKDNNISPEVIAGIMGNMEKESGFEPNNLNNAANARLGLSDEEYTTQVDNGTYTRDQFVNDDGAYGLVQWCGFGSKDPLYETMLAEKTSIGDIGMQLKHFVDPYLNCFGEGQKNELFAQKTPSAAAEYFARKYERPSEKELNQSLPGRIASAEEIYKTYINQTRPISADDTDTSSGYDGPVRSQDDANRKKQAEAEKKGMNAGKIVYKKNDGVPVTIRESPSTSSKAIGSINQGATLYYKATSDPEWFEIEYNGIHGYAHAEFIQPLVTDNGNFDPSNPNNYKKDQSTSTQIKSSGNSSVYGPSNVENIFENVSVADIISEKKKKVDTATVLYGEPDTSDYTTVEKLINGFFSDSQRPANQTGGRSSLNYFNPTVWSVSGVDTRDEYAKKLASFYSGITGTNMSRDEQNLKKKIADIAVTDASGKKLNPSDSRYWYILADKYRGNEGSTQGKQFTTALDYLSQATKSFYGGSLIGNGDTSIEIPPIDFSKFPSDIDQSITGSPVFNSFNISPDYSGEKAKIYERLMNHTFNVRSERIEQLLEEISEKLDKKKTNVPRPSSNNVNLFDEDIPNAVVRLSK